MKLVRIIPAILTAVMLFAAVPVYAAEEFVIEDGVLMGYNGTGGDVVIPDGVTEIYNTAFYTNEDITSVTIPDGVTKIGASAFHLCKNLAEISIHDSVKFIGRSAFDDTAYYLDKANWENGMLYIDNHLIIAYKVDGDITVKEGTVSIAEEAFLPSDPTSVTIPDGVSAIWNNTFQECFNLTEVILPDSVTYIDYMAFFDCRKLESVTLPKGLVEIGQSAFWKCTGLKSITIPENVTDIGGVAFMGCTNLETITIPAGVVNIGNNAFERCDKLTIHCFAGSPAVNYAIEYKIPYEILSPAGDMNGDGKVNLFDVSTLFRLLDDSGISAVPDYADVNGDGAVDLSDVTMILKYIAKWNVTLK